MDKYIFYGVQVVTTIVQSVIAWFLSEIKKNMSEKISKNEERTTKLEEKMNNMPEKYVLKCDYQITIGNINRKFESIDTKLDKIMDIVTKNAN